MDLDPKGQTVASIEAEHKQNGPDTCCQQLFALWLETPDAIWGNLMECLVDLQQRGEHSTPSALSRWLLVFLVHLQTDFYLSDGALGTLLKF